MKLDVMPLSKLATVKSGGGAPQNPSAFTVTGSPFIRAGSLPKLLNGEGEESLEKIEKQVAEGHGLSLFPAGTVLFAKSGMSAMQGHVYRLKIPAYVVSHLAALIAHVPEDSSFLVRTLQHFSPTTLIRDPSYPSIRLSDIQNMEVLAPPDSNQRHRIASILDNADALRNQRRAALAQLDTLTQSIFLDMFGDPATNPKGWPRATLDELFSISRGGSPRPIADYITDSSDGINWIMIGDASKGTKYITETKKRIKPEGARYSRTVKPGDFLLTNSMSFGRPYIMRTSGCIHDGWLVLSPRREGIEPDYFYNLLRSQAVFAEFVRRAPGVTVKNLNIDIVRDVVVAVPPRSIQKKFAKVIAATERLMATFKKSLDELDFLFAALQHRAFQGGL